MKEKDVSTLLKIAMYAIVEGKVERAIKYADKVLEIEDNIDAMTIKAEALTRLGKVQESEKIIDEVLKRQPDNMEAIQTKFMNCVWSFNLKEALLWADEGLKIDPENFDLIIGKANVMYWIGDDYFCDYIERAREIDEERTENFLRNHWIWRDDAHIVKMVEDFEDLMIDGDVDRAIAVLDEAIGLCVDRPKIDQLRWLKATALISDGRIDEAKEVTDDRTVGEIIVSAEKTSKMSLDDLLELSTIDAEEMEREELKESVEKTRIGLQELQKIQKNHLKNLEKMPVEWLNGIASNLGVKARKKKDRVRKILDVLNSKCEKIVKKLPLEAIEVLKFMIEKGGVVKYSELRRSFDCSIPINWVNFKPYSPVGLLRSHGLLMVGVMKIDGKYCKVAYVPEELRGKIKKALTDDLPDFELMEEDEALKRVKEIHEQAKKSEQYELTFKAVEALKASRPEYYQEDVIEYNQMLIESAVLSKNYRVIDKLLGPFLKPEMIDHFFDVIEMLMYYGYTKPLVNAMKSILPEIRKSEEVLPHGKVEFEDMLAMLILLNSEPYVDKIAKEVKICWNASVDEVEEFLRLLSGSGREWRKEDFHKSDRVFGNLFLLCMEFAGRSTVKSRAMLGFYAIIDYLTSHKYWNSAKKGEVLVKLKKKSFKEYLGSYIPLYTPIRVYKLASLIEVVPDYVEFVKEKGLVSEREYRRMLGIIPVIEGYRTVVKTYLHVA